MKRLVNYKRIIGFLILLFNGHGSLNGNVCDSHKDACGTQGVCDCKTEDDKKIVDCQNKNLKELPSGIPSDVQNIILSKNEIHYLKADSFVRQGHLEHLYLYRNFLPELPKDMLFNTTRLKVLDLSFNCLQKLPKDLLLNTTSLCVLDLTANKLQGLDKNFFSSLRYLKALFLSHNNLKTIADNLLSTSIYLNQLTIERNDMNMESLNFVENLTNLEILHLNGNRIKTMKPQNVQNIQHLKVLCVSENGMFIQSTRFLSSFTELQMLCLSSNKIANVPSDSFNNLSSMRALKLANISLEDIPDHLFISMNLLRDLDLKDNFLMEIRVPHFANLPELIFLNLRNNTIQRIEKGSFTHLTKVIKIDLSQNRLSTLPENLFIHSNQLEKLHLEGNMLVALPTSLFGHSSKLNKIYLSGNNIQTVPENTIQNLPFLELLDMSGNRIEEFEEKTFSNLTSLTILLLGTNRIRYLPPTIFMSLVKLQHLQLDGNKLQEISNLQFVKLGNLEVLLLTANMIRNVPNDLLISQRKLRRLDMAYNAIQELPENMLSGLFYLEDMNLSFNNVTILPYSFLHPLKKIGTLQLSQNKLKDIRKENFGILTEVYYLYLSLNRLSCLSKDLFSEVVISNTLDLSDNQLTTLPPGLFSSNNKTHGLQTLFLQKNLLTHLSTNIFTGLNSLQSLCLFHNNIQHVASGAFAEVGVENIYLFGNNLSTLDGSPFENANIKEIHLYGNEVSHLSETVLAGLDRATKVFVDCSQLIEVQRANLHIICVTPHYVPTLEVKSRDLMHFMDREGFECEDLQGKIECSPCPRGMYGGGDRSCLPCPPGGFYQDDIGMTLHGKNDVCKRCRNGTYAKNGSAVSIAECIFCPDGTNKDIHAGYRACFCLDIYARTERFGPCFVCREKGVNCSGTDYKTLEHGFYWNWNFPNANLTKYKLFVNNLKTENKYFDTNTKYDGQIPRAFRCPRRASCNNTPGDIHATCSKGYTGWLCNKCETKFYSVMDYCLPCPNTVWLIGKVVLGVSCLVILCIVILLLYKNEKSKGQTSRCNFDVLISRAKITLGFYQVVGEFFSSLHDVHWAGGLRFVGELISYIELNILQIFIRPQCFHEKVVINPKIEFIIGTTFPCVLVGLSILLYQAIKVRYTLKARGTVCTWTINKNTAPQKSKITTSVIILLFVFYPPICTVIFQLYPRTCETFCFDFTNQTCITVLRSDYDIHCEDLLVYNVFAYVATVGYVVAFPFALLILLSKIFRFRASSRLNTSYSVIREDNNSEMQNLTDETPDDDTTNPMWVDFLCESYKPQYWYWEIVELTRKVIQTVLITLLGWQDILAVLLTIGISVLFLTLHARYLPMKSSFDQRLQMFSLTAILVNVLVAAMEVPEEYGVAMSIAIVILNVVVIVIVVGEVVFCVIRRLRHLQIHNVIYRCAVSVKVSIVNVCRRKAKS